MRSEYAFIDKYVGDHSQWVSYAIHETLYSVLGGKIASTARGAPDNQAGLDGTKLAERLPWPTKDRIRKPLPNLRELFEELHVNVTLSLLSIDNLIYMQPQPDTVATITTQSNVFSYNAHPLIITYGTALVLGLIALLVGLKAYFDNGVSIKLGFLNILTTTRSRRLDRLALGTCLGAEPMPQELKKVKVRFGEIDQHTRSVTDSVLHHPTAKGDGVTVRSDTDYRHASFGIEDEVQSLQYRGKYA